MWLIVELLAPHFFEETRHLYTCSAIWFSLTASSTVLSSSRILNYKHWYEIPHLLAGNRRIAITYAAATPFGATLYSSLLFEMNNVNAFLAFTFGATWCYAAVSCWSILSDVTPYLDPFPDTFTLWTSLKLRRPIYMHLNTWLSIRCCHMWLFVLIYDCLDPVILKTADPICGLGWKYVYV